MKINLEKMNTLIFYISYLSFPFLAFLIYLSAKYLSYFTKNKIFLVILIFFYILAISFIYSRFIERYIITEKTTKVDLGLDVKVAVMADIHLGVYKDRKFLKRVVDKINKLEDISFVLIPGDLTYYPKEDLDYLFEPIKDLKYPAYAVLGNHDSEQPGPYLRDKLEKYLEKYGINFLHNEYLTFETQNLKGKAIDITILGLGDHWGNEDDTRLLKLFNEDENIIVLTHNPDTTVSYSAEIAKIADLTVTGHTHGGQIRLPFIYKHVIPCENDFDEGLYNIGGAEVFVSSGLGETGLPMRLFNPPVINVLEL